MSTILSTPMGPGFFIFFNEIFYDGERGGMQKHFEVLPRRVYLKREPGEPTLRWKDIVSPEKEIEVIADTGEKYLIIEGPAPTAKQAIKMLPKHELEVKIAEIEAELKITKKEAKAMIERIVAKELKQSEIIKGQLIREDEELALIIIMSEV